MRASECDILILPGKGGGTPDHWYARWAQKLSTAHRVEQRDFDRPVLREWTARIAEASRAAQRPVVLVGHSMGAVAGMLVAPDLDNVVAAMLVAPASARVLRTMDDVDPAFAAAPVRKLAIPALLVASRDDPYATYEEQTERAGALGATLVDAGDSGHINAESGHGPWPEGLMRFAHFLAQVKG
ncbi:MAG: alpha/beta hydrolase [Hyphomicrobiales bacterium]|nr:alpha/beta hydrolase [Hyphomicrobiales bacterium]